MKLYMHAGSYNHGCEAIVRSTIAMKQDKYVLYSESPNEDKTANLDDICTIKKQGGSRSKTSLFFIVCKLVEIIFGNPRLKYWYAFKNVISDVNGTDLYLSIGGDTYCYGANEYLMYVNKELNKRGARTGLWGCSIEPSLLNDHRIVEDLNLYSFVSARETITYNALKNKGLQNVFLYPDPAFSLEMQELELPPQFDGRVVGINISPLIQKLDNTHRIVLDNYVELVRYIIEETDFNIAFIPHVCKHKNDDRESISILSSFFPESSRIITVNTEGTMDCRQLKYIISKCCYIITARTHASIAAYSTGVPTLVVGYSVKARGIARDIFGSEKDLVLDVNEIDESTDLKNGFIKLQNNAQDIREHLRIKMPEYIKQASMASSLLREYC